MLFTMESRYQLVHPLLKPLKILNPKEKAEIERTYAGINAPFTSVFVDDWLAISIGGSVGDIIGMADRVGMTYRRVIARPNSESQEPSK